jgi:hypothetical protein
MAADSDLVTLHAEMLAVQVALIAVSRRLAAARPDLGPAFCAAFEDAETTLSGLALRVASRPRPPSSPSASSLRCATR